MKKHRFDIASGTQLRQVSLSYFSHFFGWETHTTGKSMDKFDILTRLGYSYALNKHVNLTTNFEYARFKKNPVDFFDISILIGFKF